MLLKLKATKNHLLFFTFFVAIPYRQIMVEDVTPLVLDVEEEAEDESHVHGDDGDDDQHPAVHRHPRQL